MPGFNDPFGGGTLKPSQVSYRELTLTVSLATEWPSFATDLNVLAQTMRVVSASAGLAILLPDARQASPGQQITFYNDSANAVAIQASDASPVSSVEPGGRRLVELRDNATAVGGWIVTLLGVGIGTLDVASAAGAGTKAIGTTLNVAYQVETVSSSRALAAADRDKVLIWTGGAGTLTFPASGAVPDFNVGIRNQGTGALTLAFTGGELIDGVSSLIFNNAESAWVNADTGAWYTVGRGRNAQFNFTQLQKTVTGGTVALTLTEAANVVQTYTGTLLSDVDIVLPSVVQVYYISNQTAGAFNFRIKNAAVGSTVSLPQGQNAVVFSDGVNVINASTTVAGIGAISFGAGTVAAPSVAIGAVNTGFYSPSGGSVAFSSGGTATVLLSAAGLAVTMASNALLGVTATSGTSFMTASRPAGAEAGVQINTVNSPRWIAGSDSAAESGFNAGSNFQVKRYADAGTLIDTPFSINRATGQTTIRDLRAVSDIGRIEIFAQDAVTKAGYLKLNGALVSRTTYADLWTFAQTTTPVSEATWAANTQGRFSVGDGSTTFRLPDLRGVFIRILDDGRGVDTGRTWGTYQIDTNTAHTHGVNDPSHTHGVNDPSHNHGVSDSGHTHTGSTDAQGSHQHTYDGWSNTGAGAASGFASVWNPTGAATGVAGNHAHNITTTNNGSSIGIYGNYTGVFLSAASTGISTASSGSEGRPKNYAYPAYIRY